MTLTFEVNEDEFKTEEWLDIKLCLETLFDTIAGTQPLDREFGISVNILDQPMHIAQNMFTVEAIDKVRKYEPRVAVADVTYSYDALNGKLIPHLHLVKGD